jgi:secreted Zn-dependent insulinase-like peptidase
MFLPLPTDTFHESLPVCSWAAAAPSADIALPQRNEYLPTDFELCCDQQAAQDGAADGQAAAAADANGSATAAATTAAAADIMEPSPSPFPSPPTLLLDEPGLRVWHKLDASFRQPRTASYLRLFSAAGYASPRSAALSHLTIKLLEDALCQNAYMAEVAGLHYGIWWVGVGVGFWVAVGVGFGGCEGRCGRGRGGVCIPGATRCRCAKAAKRWAAFNLTI